MDGFIISSELYHHGILGQKWGVRRFQNEDGTLTDEGRKRYYGSRTSYNMDDKEAQDYMRTYGVSRSTDDTDIISKGSVIKRIANSDEPIDSKRKYASITDNDAHNYREMFDMIGVDLSKPLSEYEYETTKDLKVASAKKVVSDLLEKYGDTKIRDLGKMSILDTGYRVEEWDSDIEIGQKEVQKFLKTQMHEKLDDITKQYIKEGYDAIIDVEDASFSNYPIILLNPKESIKLKKEDRWP